MGLLYLDPTLDHTDPASSGLKVLDAGLPSWDNPDAGRLALDARNEWTAPVLKPRGPQTSEELNAMSWADIEELSAAAARNPASYLYMVDDSHKLEKDVDLSALGNGCTIVKARIVGVYHDVDPQGDRIGLTFRLCDGLPCDGFRMNLSGSTGGWKSSLMRSTNILKIKESLPSDLRGRIKTMVKMTVMAYDGDAAEETQDEIALPSVREVFGSSEIARAWWALEGEQYEWYAAHNTNNNRIINDSRKSARQSWLRSIVSTAGYAIVDVYGNRNGAMSNSEFMPCPCFCV